MSIDPLYGMQFSQKHLTEMHVGGGATFGEQSHPNTDSGDTMGAFFPIFVLQNRNLGPKDNLMLLLGFSYNKRWS